MNVLNGKQELLSHLEPCCPGSVLECQHSTAQGHNYLLQVQEEQHHSNFLRDWARESPVPNRKNTLSGSLCSGESAVEGAGLATACFSIQYPAAWNEWPYLEVSGSVDWYLEAFKSILFFHMNSPTWHSHDSRIFLELRSSDYCFLCCGVNSCLFLLLFKKKSNYKYILKLPKQFFFSFLKHLLQSLLA